MSTVLWNDEAIDLYIMNRRSKTRLRTLWDLAQGLHQAGLLTCTRATWILANRAQARTIDNWAGMSSAPYNKQTHGA